MGLIVQIEKQIGEFHLNLDVQTQARRIGILGPSGCGKSMTLKCIAGILSPDKGRIAADNHVFYDSDTRKNQKVQMRKVGYLFQNYALFPNMTVEENIMAGLKFPKREKRKVAQSFIEKFHLEGFASRLPHQLSGGQQQRTALARILASEPDIILLDEPFSALDTHLKEQLQLELEFLLSDYPGIVVMVSHSRDEIFRFSEELIVLDGGKQAEYGRTKELFLHPSSMQAARLTGCKNISRIEKTGEREVFAKDWNMTLQTNELVTEEMNYIGIRAHDIMKINGEKSTQTTVETIDKKENVFKMQIIHTTELPFEMQYLLKNTVTDNETQLWWKIAKPQALSPAACQTTVNVCFPKEKLILLK